MKREAELKDEKEIVAQVDIGLRYVNRLLENIAGTRSALYTEKGLRELVYSIFIGRKYKANIDLEDLQINLKKLERAALFYLKISRGGKYTPYFERFLEDYQNANLSFIKVSQYSKLREKVRADLKHINMISPLVYKKIRQNYAMIYKVGEGVNEIIESHRTLDPNQKNILLQKVNVLEKYGKVFEDVLMRHFDQLKKVQKTAQALSVAFSKFRAESDAARAKLRKL